MNELTLFHRSRTWDVLPGRYASVRKQLIRVRFENSALSSSHRSKIQAAIMQLREDGKLIENSLIDRRTESLDVAALSDAIAEQSDKLSRVLTEIERSVGGR
jgi:transcription elongation GreA/GreB family factor